MRRAQSGLLSGKGKRVLLALALVLMRAAGCDARHGSLCSEHLLCPTHVNKQGQHPRCHLVPPSCRHLAPPPAPPAPAATAATGKGVVVAVKSAPHSHGLSLHIRAPSHFPCDTAMPRAPSASEFAEAMGVKLLGFASSVWISATTSHRQNVRLALSLPPHLSMGWKIPIDL